MFHRALTIYKKEETLRAIRRFSDRPVNSGNMIYSFGRMSKSKTTPSDTSSDEVIKTYKDQTETLDLLHEGLDKKLSKILESKNLDSETILAENCTMRHYLKLPNANDTSSTHTLESMRYLSNFYERVIRGMRLLDTKLETGTSSPGADIKAYTSEVSK